MKNKKGKENRVVLGSGLSIYHMRALLCLKGHLLEGNTKFKLEL